MSTPTDWRPALTEALSTRLNMRAWLCGEEPADVRGSAEALVEALDHWFTSTGYRVESMEARMLKWAVPFTGLAPDEIDDLAGDLRAIGLPARSADFNAGVGSEGDRQVTWIDRGGGRHRVTSWAPLSDPHVVDVGGVIRPA